MKIIIASDHRGYKLKEELKKRLGNKYEFIDLGTNNEDSVDYPDYAFKLGKKVLKDNCFGIAICGSGIGISIACNKVKGIRCAKVNTIKDSIVTRNDNDSNIIAFSANTSIKKAIRMVEEFVNTPFSNEKRHLKRIEKIKEYESLN